jgi:ADP-ribose pyrophosphatase YjhB (NUDIX family)
MIGTQGENLMDDLHQTLYLIADEMRGMANLGGYFAQNVYEIERADRIMELAARIAALAGNTSQAEVQPLFDRDAWFRVSPAIGVEAAVFNAQSEILLIQRRDNGHWAIPGGVAEIGRSLAESALLELWEEAGLRGRVERLLGMFDGRMWGSRVTVHIVHMIFLVQCDDLRPTPGLETLDARFFPRDQIPAPLHPGHDRRIPACFETLGRQAFFDAADSRDVELPLYQRPSDSDVF